MNTPDPAHRAVRTAPAVAPLLRPGLASRTPDVAAADREHAATIVAHLLHEECQQWSWTEHHPETHRPEARRIVGALCREGWVPRAATHGGCGRDGCDGASGAA